MAGFYVRLEHEDGTPADPTQRVFGPQIEDAKIGVLAVDSVAVQ